MIDGSYRNPIGRVLVIEPRVSLMLASILSVAHLTTLLVLVLLPLPWWILLPLAGTVLLSLGHVLQRHVLMKGRKAVKKLIWDAHGTLKLLNGEEKELNAALCCDTFISRLLIVLNLRTSQLGNHSLVLLPDSLTQDLMRQLRARVRLFPTQDQSIRSSG